MKRYFMPIVAVVVICATFVACQPAGGLSETDQAAIRKVVDDAVKMTNDPKVDYGAYVNLYYAQDAMVLMPGMPALQGRDAIKATFAGLPPTKEFKVNIVSLEGRGEMAYVHGTYLETLAPPGGAPPITDKGKYIEIWKKQTDGSWKVIRDIWNSDQPTPGLTISAGAARPDASPELKKLDDLIGTWKIDGDAKATPAGPAGKVSYELNCQWHTGGSQVVCQYVGTQPKGPYKEISIYSYEPTTKAYSVYSVSSDGLTSLGRLTIDKNAWTHVWDIRANGKPMKFRLALSEVSPTGGKWKTEISEAGGPWMLSGEGKYERAK